MKIAFIHPRHPSAEGTGATHSATQIVEGLAKAGHDIDVFCASKSEEKIKNYKGNIDYYHLAGNSRYPHTNTRLNREVKSRADRFTDYDIVHSYLMSLIPSISEIGEYSDVSTVITLNAYGAICPKNDLLYLNKTQCKEKTNLKCLNCISRTGFNEKYNYIYNTASQLFSMRLINKSKKHLKNIDRFQALSTQVKDTYSRFGFPEGHIQVIPNILDEMFLVEHQSDFENPYKLIYVGSLKKSKGVMMLPKIMSYLGNESDMSFTLTIVGNGGLHSKLKSEFINRDVASRVTFTGRISNDKLPDIYANHDLFVYTGIWNEPFGRVFIESLAAGTPVIGTNVGALKSIVGSAGIVTEPIPENIGDAIHQLVKSQRIKGLADNTKMEANRFLQYKIIRQFELMYESIVDE